MKKYTLFGTDIIFDDASERAYEVQINYEFTKSRITDLFQTWYEKQGSIQNVLKNFPGFVHQTYYEGFASDQFRNDQKSGIYNMTFSMYKKRCVSTIGAQDAIESIESSYEAIIDKQDKAEEYFASNKTSQDRRKGDGCSLDGTPKGAATTGASKAGARLYDSNTTRSMLLNGMYQDIRTFYNNHIAILNQEKPGWIASDFNEERAAVLFEKAKKFPSKREELLVQSFELCPWNEELQRYIFHNYSENRREILRVSTDFGIGIYDCVEDLLQSEYTDADKASKEKMLAAGTRIRETMAEFGVKRTRVLDRLEADLRYGLYQRQTIADEKTYDSSNEMQQGHDAQRENKGTVLNKNSSCVDETQLAGDAIECKTLYLNTDIRNPDQVKKAIKQIKDQKCTDMDESYVRALESCRKNTINRARRYQRGIFPKIYATLAWAGLPLAAVNDIWIQAGDMITWAGIAMMVIFGIMYIPMRAAWNKLSIDGTVVHTALTENNPSIEMKVPAPVLSISVAGLMLLGVFGYHAAAVQREAEAEKQAAYEARVQEYEARKAAEAKAAQTDAEQSK